MSIPFLPGHKTVLGMVHLAPLPGTPFYAEGSFDRIIDRAVESARALHDGGADGCLVQTVDRVYSVLDECDPARAAAMAIIVRSIAQATGSGFHIGVQIMRNAVQASLGVAKVAGGAFVRAGALVGATLTEHGLMTAAPLDVMSYRAGLQAWDIDVVADVGSMQYRWFGDDRSVGDVARRAVNVGANAVALGDPDEAVTLAMIESVRSAVPGVPIILAGYTNHANAARLLAVADGAFVGTCLEQGGWGGAIDRDRVRSYVDIVRSLEPHS